MLMPRSSQARKAELRLNLERGKACRQDMTAVAEVKQNVSGMQVDITMTIICDINYLVKSYDAGVYSMDITYQRLRMEMDIPYSGLVVLDTDDLEGNPASGMLAGMLDKPLATLMDNKGKVLEMKGFEEMFESMFEQMPELGEEQKQQVRQQFESQYGEDNFKRNFEMAMAMYPDHAVAPGDKWTVNSAISSGMVATVSTEFEFVEQTKAYNIIKGVSVINTVPDEYVDMGGAKIKYDLTGTMTSDIKVDAATGWVIESVIRQEIAGDAFIQAGPTGEMKSEMQMINDMVVLGE